MHEFEVEVGGVRAGFWSDLRPAGAALFSLCILSANPAAAAPPPSFSPAETEALRLLAPGELANPTEVSVSDAHAVVEANPRDADAWHQLGEALQVAGNLDGAVEAYRKATTLPPKDIGRAYLHRDLAEALEQAGDLDGALAAARVSVRTWPVSTQGLFCSGAEVLLLTRLLVETHDAKGAAAFYRPLAAEADAPEECRTIAEALRSAAE
ncbi:tetratricopeptide repeat protein [Sphingosinicella sp. BN140058]|uniref:tetratricopeptide repeat protein n=1 Tax=Sphingosinicella sp. BN140058 TaxID=1892855 RepID=UPI00101142E5|nr:tetratricopeptide repeat protein [Sphingosinicella sp. BN140058]QAY78448.1 tetratricopeptide repeat protein [Sphingosinicella sp. BN140058]